MFSPIQSKATPSVWAMCDGFLTFTVLSYALPPKQIFEEFTIPMKNEIYGFMTNKNCAFFPQATRWAWAMCGVFRTCAVLSLALTQRRSFQSYFSDETSQIWARKSQKLCGFRLRGGPGQCMALSVPVRPERWRRLPHPLLHHDDLRRVREEKIILDIYIVIVWFF